MAEETPYTDPVLTTKSIGAIFAHVSCTLDSDPKTNAQSKADLENFAICCERHSVAEDPVNLYELVLLLRSLMQKAMNGDTAP